MPVAGPMAVQLVSQNVSSNTPLPEGGRIELGFDRFLSPTSITRQTFVLQDSSNNFLTPQVAYDPVARVVTITPNPPLVADQLYSVTIETPAGASDPNGLRAIDGATLSGGTKSFSFQVVAADGGVQPSVPTIDFCNDVFPLFNVCGGSICHTGSAPAEGLNLGTLQSIAATAVGRVSQESNTGPQAMTEPPGRVFGIDMPIIDTSTTGGNPAHSWMLYKLLMADPLDPSAALPLTCNNATPTDVGSAHLVPTSPASDTERATLSNFVLGREMPYPSSPGAPIDAGSRLTLSFDQLERISLWIAQAPPATGLIPATCACGQ